jgi:hypothetical protein
MLSEARGVQVIVTRSLARLSMLKHPISHATPPASTCSWKPSASSFYVHKWRFLLQKCPNPQLSSGRQSSRRPHLLRPPPRQCPRCHKLGHFTLFPTHRRTQCGATCVAAASELGSGNNTQPMAYVPHTLLRFLYCMTYHSYEYEMYLKTHP